MPTANFSMKLSSINCPLLKTKPLGNGDLMERVGGSTTYKVSLEHSIVFLKSYKVTILFSFVKVKKIAIV
jgi:hypothetical protein